MLAVAAADGKPTDKELEMVKLAAAYLGMPVEEMRAELEVFMDRRWIV